MGRCTSYRMNGGCYGEKIRHILRSPANSSFFFFNEPPPTKFYPLSLPAPFPILEQLVVGFAAQHRLVRLGELDAHDQREDPADDERKDPGGHVHDADQLVVRRGQPEADRLERSEEHTSELQSQSNLVCRLLLETK